MRKLIVATCLLILQSTASPLSTASFAAEPGVANLGAINSGDKDVAVIDRVRFYPARGHEQDMLGGQFSGSNTGLSDDYRLLGKIDVCPIQEKWTELTLDNQRPFRYVRYEAPPGSYGRIAELEFYAGKVRLRGPAFSSVGPDEAPGSWKNAFDGKVDTYVQSAASGNQFVGMDFQEVCSCKKPTFSPRPGTFAEPVQVELQSRTSGATIYYTTDGTEPGAKNGIKYDRPLSFNERTCLQCVATKDGMASSPLVFGVYQLGKPDMTMHTLHVGNSLTASTHSMPLFASTVGIEDDYHSFLHGGATTKVLWEDATGPKKDEWEKTLGGLSQIDHFTLQPRDFHIDEEADYDTRFLKVVRDKCSNVQPWLYAEWVEFDRKRPTDLGREESGQMSKVWPALTWEESMSAMLLYVEDLQRKLAELDKDHQPPRIIPSAIAMGWIHRFVEEGKVPGMAPGSFHANLFADGVHPNPEGCYLVDLTWISAFTGKCVDDVLPMNTKLTAAQAKLMRKISWDTVKNYPGSGLYEEGNHKVSPAKVKVVKKAGDIATIALSSKTPGAWFRYTLDGSAPTHTHGYIYCGVVSLQPGMQLRVVAYKSGMADSAVIVNQSK